MKIYVVLAGIMVMITAGWYLLHLQKQADVGQANTAELYRDAKLNADTQTHTLAAATHIQAVQANKDTLKADISHRFTAPSGGTHATYAPAADTDPFGTVFVMCYNSGSRGDRTCQAGDLLPRPPGDTGNPPR